MKYPFLGVCSIPFCKQLVMQDDVDSELQKVDTHSITLFGLILWPNRTLDSNYKKT